MAITFREPLYSQRYVDAGEGRAVILLHGLFENLGMWRHTIHALKKEYRVIVPRLPLFEIPIHRANVNHLVEVLHDFLDWHQLTEVSLIGSSLGGQIALCYAYEHPDRVRKIVLSGSSGLFENTPPLKTEITKDFDFVDQKVREAFYREENATPGVVNQVFDAVSSDKKSLHLSMFAKSSKAEEVSRFLYKLEVPVLLLWGKQDRITPPEVALHFHDLLRFGEVKFIDQCGHLPMIEQREIYNDHILEFFNR